MKNEKAAGVIVVYQEAEENYFLLLQHKDAEGSWSFPKGHIEENETVKETALRELQEETGIAEIDLLDTEPIHEEYMINAGQDNARFKTNEYFIGCVKSKDVTIQESEINTYVWVAYDEALDIFRFEGRKEVLRKAKEYLEVHEIGK